MPSSHLILCHPPLLLLPIPPSIRVFSSESTFRMGWPKYWSFSFSISPSIRSNSQTWAGLSRKPLMLSRDRMPLLQQELASSAADFFAVVRERGCSLPFAGTGASVKVRQCCLQLVEMGHVPGLGVKNYSQLSGDRFSSHQTSKVRDSSNNEGGSDAGWPQWVLSVHFPVPIQCGPRASYGLSCRRRRSGIKLMAQVGRRTGDTGEMLLTVGHVITS